MNTQDGVFDFFYNIGRKYYVVNNFAIEINYAILLTCTTCVTREGKSKTIQNLDTKVKITVF